MSTLTESKQRMSTYDGSSETHFNPLIAFSGILQRRKPHHKPRIMYFIFDKQEAQLSCRSTWYEACVHTFRLCSIRYVMAMCPILSLFVSISWRAQARRYVLNAGLLWLSGKDAPLITTLWMAPSPLKAASSPTSHSHDRPAFLSSASPPCLSCGGGGENGP